MLTYLLIQKPLWSTEQVTLGITAQSYLRVHIDNRVYDLDVGSGHPNGAAAIKGSFVQRLKSYVIWVQTGAIQVGFYLFKQPLPVRKDKRSKASLTEAP